MNKFSERSLLNLGECEPDLRRLFEQAIRLMDCSILEGHRGRDKQEQYFKEGKSKVRWPNSKHNSFPSDAVDVAPFPIDWNNNERFYVFAGIVYALAWKMNIKVRWGGCWKGDMDFKNNSFDDLVHWELVK